MGGVEGEERKMHGRVEGREGGIKNFITKYKLLTHFSLPPSLPPSLPSSLPPHGYRVLGTRFHEAFDDTSKL